jgi:hypothetical protein
MTALESRYRRLLAAYPADHRQAYEREMLGVLMSGSRPGQRFPGPAEVVDLLRAGWLARVGAGRRALRSDTWRDAAAVVSLVTALWMVATAGAAIPFGVRFSFYGESFLETTGMEGAGLALVPLRIVVWLAVVIAILAGRRRAAAALGVAALVVEVIRFGVFLPIDAVMAMSDAWSPVVIALALGTLFVAIPGRAIGTILTRRGAGLMVAGVAFGAVAFSGALPYWTYGSTIGTQPLGLPEPTLMIAAGLMVAGAWSAGDRVLVLLSPAIIVPFAHAVLWHLPIMPMIAAAVVLAAVLTVVPIVTLLSGLALMRRREAVSGGATEVM